MFGREYHNENCRESDWKESRQTIWLSTIAEIIRNHSVIIRMYTLFGALFLLICAVDLVNWIQYPLLAIVFGALIYIQLEYKDSRVYSGKTRKL